MLSWGFFSPLIRNLDVRMHFNVMFKRWKLASKSHLTSVKGQNSTVHRMWDSCSVGVTWFFTCNQLTAQSCLLHEGENIPKLEMDRVLGSMHINNGGSQTIYVNAGPAKSDNHGCWRKYQPHKQFNRVALDYLFCEATIYVDKVIHKYICQ